MKIDNPTVSVVIPCYNDEKFITETLNSILNQTFKDLNVIIVDDGSDEVTKKVLSTLISNKVQVISQLNKGLSAARNTGFKAAKGDYIVTIDSDDTVEPTFIEKAILIFKNDSCVGAVSSYVNVFRNKNQITSEYKPKGGGIKDFLFDNNSVSFAMIRKKVWEQVGGYDEKMIKGFEDWEFWISITKKGWKVAIIPELLFNYRHKKKSMSTNAKANHREANLKYIYIKHQDVYVKYFTEVVDFLTDLAQRHKRNEIKYKNGLEFKIGKIFLMPFRKLKRFFKR